MDKTKTFFSCTFDQNNKDSLTVYSFHYAFILHYIVGFINLGFMYPITSTTIGTFFLDHDPGS